MLDGQDTLSGGFRIGYGIEENQPANVLNPASVIGGEQTIAANEVAAENVIPESFCVTGARHERTTILLVEDEAFVRRVAAEVLEAAGYHLLIACNASEALEVVHRQGGTIDLLLVDIVMPGMSGRELAVKFGCFYPAAQVLLMSGYAEQFAQADRYGREVYLAKPFAAHTLLDTVRRLLNQNAFIRTAVA
jgi:CheY-like chemotaxis protein